MSAAEFSYTRPAFFWPDELRKARMA